jgi:hypothetical protein
MTMYILRINEKEWHFIQRAVLHARDTAFLTVGDKDDPRVKEWEAVMATVSEVEEA